MNVQDAIVKDTGLVVQRRAEIVHAAVLVFSQRGYQTARTSDVCKAAKVAQGTFYNYIRSKEDLLYLICEELVAARMSGLEESLRNSTHPKKRLVGAVRANIQTAIQYPDHTRLVFRENHGLSPSARDAIRSRIAEHILRTEELLIDASAAGYCKFENARIAANICTFLPSITALRHWAFDGNVAEDELVHEVLTSTLRAVGCKL